MTVEQLRALKKKKRFSRISTACKQMINIVFFNLGKELEEKRKRQPSHTHTQEIQVFFHQISAFQDCRDGLPPKSPLYEAQIACERETGTIKNQLGKLSHLRTWRLQQENVNRGSQGTYTGSSLPPWSRWKSSPVRRAVVENAVL